MSSRRSNRPIDPTPSPAPAGLGSVGVGSAIRAEALRLGFFAIGFAKADKVDDAVARHLRQWLDSGGNAGMAYMEKWYEKRCDPRLLMPGVKTIVSVALNYAPAHTLPADEPQIAAYALGKDYHDVMKQKLRQLATYCASLKNKEERIENKEYEVNAQCSTLNAQCFCDTGPVLERYWAVQAGLGWIGRNHQLIIPHAGSMFFLGELFIDMELPYDHPIASRCGKCHKCIDACPTKALGKDSLDARLCLSYQTIENRGELSEMAKATMGDTFYGCDRCQRACPWNRFTTPNTTPELQPSDELLQMTREKWLNLTVDDYRRLFKGSAVKRAKYSGLMRNINNLKGRKE